MPTLLTPLSGIGVMTSGTAPSVGKINVYDATSGAITATLPALSGLSVGSRLIVAKSTVDTSGNAVTINCNSGNTFQDGSTASLILGLAGTQFELMVIKPSTTKYWAFVGSLPTPGTVVTLNDTQTMTNKRLTSPKINQILDINGNPALSIAATASAVNYAQFSNAAAGGRVAVKAVGSDTDIGINVQAAGAAGHFFNNANGVSFRTVPPASGTIANYLTTLSQTTGTDPTLTTAYSTDSNVGFDLTTKGTGVGKLNGKPISSVVSTPSTASSSGTVGQLATDGTYLYVCTAANTWKRVGISTW